jgi:hypothetical protein
LRAAAVLLRDLRFFVATNACDLIAAVSGFWFLVSGLGLWGFGCFSFGLRGERLPGGG